MRIVIQLDILEGGKAIRSVASHRSITDAGWEFIMRCIGDPSSRPPVANTLGIGWGSGSTTPFDRTQMELQGAHTSFKSSSFVYNPAETVQSCRFEAAWGVNEPLAEDVWIGEIGLFSGSTLIDRTPVTPTLKRANQEAVVNAVVTLEESAAEFSVY